MTVEDYWDQVTGELREARLQAEVADPGYPSYMWDVHGMWTGIPVSYVIAAREFPPVLGVQFKVTVRRKR